MTLTEEQYLSGIEDELRASITGYFTPAVWYANSMISYEMLDAWFHRQVTVDEVREEFDLNKQTSWFIAHNFFYNHFKDAQDEIKRDASKNFGGI